MLFLFLSVLRAGITAALAVVVVIFARLLLKGAPKWISCLLWALVGIRLLCPVLPLSELSIIPQNVFYSEGLIFENVDSEYITTDSVLADGGNRTEPAVEVSEIAQKEAVDNGMSFAEVALFVWLAGAVLLLIYGAVSYVKVKRRFRDAVLFRDNIYLSEKAASPFVMGFIKPGIYIPYNLDDETFRQVLLHEQAHIRRLDHISKPLGFALLCIHWFNPFVWAAYILFCRDVEVACDEKVIKNYELEQKKAYATALLRCKMSSRIGYSYPIAFGEVGVATRIKRALRYKKPAVVIGVFSLILTTALALCLLTNPVSAAENTVIRNYAKGRVTQEYGEHIAPDDAYTESESGETIQVATEQTTQKVTSRPAEREQHYEDETEGAFREEITEPVYTEDFDQPEEEEHEEESLPQLVAPDVTESNDYSASDYMNEDYYIENFRYFGDGTFDPYKPDTSQFENRDADSILGIR